MKHKTRRTVLDIAMTVLLPMLMAYSLIGETFHEVIGTAMLLLFVTHHILRTAADLLLLVLMILQPVSGILMSRHLYTFIQIGGISAVSREVHLMAAYWSFVLLSVHAGMHLAAPMRRIKSKAASGWLTAIWIPVSAYGIYAFIKRQLPDYMFRKTIFAYFDFSEPRIYFFLDYLAIMLLFGLIGYLLIRLTAKNRKE